MTQIDSDIPRHYHQLTSEQRGQIEALHDLNRSNAAIARKLHCHRSTIGCELKRGRVLQRNSDYFLYHHYYGETAQAKHEQRRLKCHCHSLLKRGHFFFKLLTKQLGSQFNAMSVDEFIGQFKLKFPDQFCPSTPTVYRYIDQGRLAIKNLDLPQKLSRHLKKHHRSHSRQAVKQLGVSIEKRPQKINQRQRPFDWEGDLVKGVRRKNQPALMTLTERLTRFEIVIKIPNYRAETCRQEPQKVINYHPNWFNSITFDNGAEFSTLAKIRHAKIYFAHPYSPWERGSNENNNGLLRQFYPKGQPIKQSLLYLHQAVQAINTKPRKLLYYHTAQQCFHQYLAS